MENVDSKSVIGASAAALGAAWENLTRSQRLRIQGWVGWTALLTLLFIRPLGGLAVHAAQSSLHSHILLVPFIAAYLLYAGTRPHLTAYGSSIAGTAMLGGIGLAALAAGTDFRGTLSVNDYLAIMTLSYLSLFAAGGFLFLGSKWMTALAFPLTFLVFMVPLPDRAVDWLETASVLASADVSAWLFNATGTPLLRHGDIFELPGIVLRVAQECSGIRSTWVLFITSLVASHVFLKSPWRRLVLVAFIIPLAIVRNGFRILVIGLLCVHVGPHMIDSMVHHRGGPIFFVLSLVPLFLLLLWLRRQERRTHVLG